MRCLVSYTFSPFTSIEEHANQIPRSRTRWRAGPSSTLPAPAPASTTQEQAVSHASATNYIFTLAPAPFPASKTAQEIYDMISEKLSDEELGGGFLCIYGLADQTGFYKLQPQAMPTEIPPVLQGHQAASQLTLVDKINVPYAQRIALLIHFELLYLKAVLKDESSGFVDRMWYGINLESLKTLINGWKDFAKSGPYDSMTGELLPPWRKFLEERGLGVSKGGWLPWAKQCLERLPIEYAP